MHDAFPALLLLFAAIAFIIWGTARRNLNAFFVLLLAAIGTGLLAGLPPGHLVEGLKTGFGDTMSKIGIVILLGTALGVLLEKTGATLSLANFILDKIGQKNAPEAIGMTGFTVGLPIFCDSGFVILSGLNRALTQVTRFGMPVMATALATGLYSVHCLVPPHPGISAACGTMGADIGQVMLWGMLLAVPAAVAGNIWAKKIGARYAASLSGIDNVNEPKATIEDVPPTIHPAIAALPILLPIFLIGFKTVLFFYIDSALVNRNYGLQLVSFAGEPAIALLLAIGVALLILPPKKAPINDWLTEGIVKAALVLAITAAGGAFGNILKMTNIGGVLGESLSTLNLGIWLPFLLAVMLKTAQGSSTVAVITAASLIAPMIPQLGLDSDWGRITATLAMGAGSMAVSYGNDSFFWVISRFSDVAPGVMFRVYSTATFIMAVIVQVCIWLAVLIF